MTGFTGIFGTALSAQEVFDKIKDTHGFGTAGLSDADNGFTDDVDTGRTLYDDGIGTNIACAVCHGADGLTINFKDPPDEEFVGDLASDNPWEFQHKVRFGHPGTAMPAAVDVDGTNDNVADVGAYAQTLP